MIRSAGMKSESQPWYQFIIERPKRPENPKRVLKLNRVQAFTFTAAFLGWALDAFDFHLASFAIKDIANEFGVSESVVTGGTTITLMLRPLGAIVFGLLADRFGRRIPLMVDVMLFSLMGLLTGFAQNMWQFLVLRAVFGICMGGEWGLGASLAMEALPMESRGIFSGILQQGYATGYLLASLVFMVVHDQLGWRAMFWIGSFPALLALAVRFLVPESEAWKQEQQARGDSSMSSWIQTTGLVFKRHFGLLMFTVVLMAGLNFMSHGTQDLFPTYLRSQLLYSDGQVFTTTLVANLGAIVGGTLVGFFSQYLGRRRSVAFVCLLGICFVPIWGIAGKLGQGVQMLGAFLLQFCVQGAWGVVPAFLTESSPSTIRGTFPGLTYQLGNLISASAAQIEAILGEKFHLPNGLPNYGLTQSVMAWMALSITFILILFANENPEKNFLMDDKELN
ncbi:Carboxylic acid transporter, partial [Massospora cicadina]